MAGHFSTPKSELISGIEWRGDRLPYPEPEVKGDSFPMTWADDGEIYTSAGDPGWGESPSGLDIEKFSGGPAEYRITQVNSMKDFVGWGGEGPKPTGMICVDGILYLAVQNLLGSRTPPFNLLSQHASDATILFSASKGVWSWAPALKTISTPMFLGHHFGGPAFVNFGQNNANARDGYVYAVSGDQWDNGSNLRLGRVRKDQILRSGAWEWVAAFTPSGEPVWSYELGEAVPILSLHRWLSTPEMVYLESIQRYLLFTWHLEQDFGFDRGSDLLVFEAPDPWGPFSLVHLEELWEGNVYTPYCPRLPLKWIEPDGISAWLQFSGSWGPVGQQEGFYRSNVRPFRLKMR